VYACAVDMTRLDETETEQESSAKSLKKLSWSCCYCMSFDSASNRDWQLQGSMEGEDASLYWAVRESVDSVSESKLLNVVGR